MPGGGTLRVPGGGGILGLVGDDLRDRAGVRYTELGARSILNRVDTERMPDCWTINPYRGCSFGCAYCYARYTHEFLGLEQPADFERRIFVKLEAPAVLAAEADERKLRARPIAIGTATDPYQPAEARYQLTRGILEVLAGYRGLRVSITTKSALIVRDRDLLCRIREHSRLSVHVTVVTTDRELARRMEPGAPTPLRRLRTVRALAEAGVPVGVNAMPVMPGINDSRPALAALFRRAADHGAAWVSVAPLFLASGSRRHFLEWLRSEMPEKLALYRRLFLRGVDVTPAWRRQLRSRVAQLRTETGLGTAPRDRPAAALQLELPGLVPAASTKRRERTR